MANQLYIARCKLLILEAPGTVPSSTRNGEDEIFELDGTGRVDVGRLLARGHIAKWEPPKAPEAPAAETPRTRRRLKTPPMPRRRKS